MLNIRILFVGILITLALTKGSQYVPIPKKLTGTLFGSPSAQVQVELIYDPQCDGSSDLNKNIQELIKQLGNLTDSKISFRYHLLPLPYHIFSMKMAQGNSYIKEANGDQVSLSYINFLMNNLEKYYESAMLNVSLNDFESQLTNDVVAALPTVNKAYFNNSLKHGSKYDILAREDFKHVTGSKSISGTPQVFINGAMVDGGENWTVPAWLDKLNSLLA